MKKNVKSMKRKSSLLIRRKITMRSDELAGGPFSRMMIFCSVHLGAYFSGLKMF